MNCAQKFPTPAPFTAGQRGEAFVMARFDTFNVGAQIIVVPKDLPYKWPDQIAEYNYIDTRINAKLKKLRIIPLTCVMTRPSSGARISTSLARFRL
jgi:hypothetical protein